MSLQFKAPEATLFGTTRDHEYPAPIELLHISIAHVGPGIDELVHFYQVALNMRFCYRVTYPTFEFIAISHDDENHRLGFVNVLSAEPRDGAQPSDRAIAKAGADTVPRDLPQRACRIEHTSWLYRSFEDVLRAAKRIHQELGIWPRTTRHAGMDLTIDYNDPDGNRVEMLSQFPGRAQILRNLEKMFNAPESERREYSDSYMSMNMEKLIGLYESGVPIKQLQDREFCRALVKEGKL